MYPVEFQGMRPGERLLHGIERAGADIAEDYPDRTEDKRRHGRLFRMGPGLWMRDGFRHFISAVHALHPFAAIL